VLNVVICGGFSPGARVLRAAMRAIASCGNVNVITLGPSLAGLEKPVDDIRALDPSITVVVDACEGGCGNQGLAKFGVIPRAVLVLPKYPMLSEKNVKDAEARVSKFIEGARAQ
jgi:hypothetical protein